MALGRGPTNGSSRAYFVCRPGCCVLVEIFHSLDCANSLRDDALAAERARRIHRRGYRTQPRDARKTNLPCRRRTWPRTLPEGMTTSRALASN
jgi:hypothetical protein